MSTNIEPVSSKSTLALEWAILLLIIAVATFLRYWKIGDVPPGFNSDEAVGAVGALTTLREGLQYSYEGQGGGGALGFYFAAAAFYLFGPSIETIRGLAAWAGVVSIFVNYWAIREIFRQEGLTRARLIATLATFTLAVSLWHVTASRIAFAGIGVPFLMLPSVYFLWLGLNRNQPSPQTEAAETVSPKVRWPFALSGLFLGALMYIYLSGVFAPPLYAAFFIGQGLIFWLGKRLLPTRLFNPNPPRAYMTSQFWNLFITAMVAIVLLLPILYVLATRPEAEPGAERVSQAFFMNPRISQGDPWGLLWRSFEGNFAAYGISVDWLMGQTPRLTSFVPPVIGLLIFIGFSIALLQALRGRAAYLFVWLWYGVMLFPSILAPDVIPHHLRTIGATTPTYVFLAITIVTALEILYWVGYYSLRYLLGLRFYALFARGAVAIIMGMLLWQFWQLNEPLMNHYFYVYPQTNDAEAAYHVYAVRMAETINAEERADVAFILPRNTAAGDVFRNFTTDFLVELAQPPAAHYWVIDNEATLPYSLTLAAENHPVLRVVHWKTSKHTGADPKEIIPYYLEKYGYLDHTHYFDDFDLKTYQLEQTAPDFTLHESLQPTEIAFGTQNPLILTGYAFGDASEVSHVAQPTVNSGDLLWVRLAWQLERPSTESLKASLLLDNEHGQRVVQIDKRLQNNILQVDTTRWSANSQESTYVLLPLPPATPPGAYRLRLAVYGEQSLNRRLPLQAGQPLSGAESMVDLGEVQVNPAQRAVEVNGLALAVPVEQELLPGLTLLGFETLPNETVRSGETVRASLIWQAGESPATENVEVAFIAKAGEGEQIWQLSEPAALTGQAYPTSRWQPHEILRGWLQARIPPTLEAGEYKLQLRFSPAGRSDEELLRLPIGDFQIEGWPRNFDAPAPMLDVEANFNQQATLVGVDLAAETLKPGESLQATLYWQAEAEFADDYTAFAHLIGPDGALYGQVDQTPGGGAYPTTGWLSGEYLHDDYTLQISPTAPAGDYQIGFGMYNPKTGERLRLDCKSDICDETNRMVRVGGLTITAP